MTTCPRCEMPDHDVLCAPDWRGFTSCKSSECPMRMPIDRDDYIKKFNNAINNRFKMQEQPKQYRSLDETQTSPVPSGLSSGSIVLLLWIHTGGFDQSTKTVHLEQLRNAGLVESFVAKAGESPWRLTDRGRVFVEAIMALPLPVATWSMPKS